MSEASGIEPITPHEYGPVFQRNLEYVIELSALARQAKAFLKLSGAPRARRLFGGWSS